MPLQKRSPTSAGKGHNRKASRRNGWEHGFLSVAVRHIVAVHQHITERFFYDSEGNRASMSCNAYVANEALRFPGIQLIQEPRYQLPIISG